MLEKINTFAPKVDDFIKSLISDSGHPNFYEGMDYSIFSGGKRIRPVLCMMICEALGGDPDKALPVAAAIETLHNATLVHDDMEDGDDLRRGQPTVWKKYGIPYAINIGDGMIFKAYQSILKSELPPETINELMRMFTAVCIELTEGQNMEFNFRTRKDVTEEEYMEMARRKAGVLFGFSLAAGAMVAGADEKVVSLLYEYGIDTGLAFMIRDDVLNITGDFEKYGKEIGGDIREGKRTLMVIDCLSKCDETDRDVILNILSRSREEVREDDVNFVIGKIKGTGSIAYAQEASEEISQQADEMVSKITNEDLSIILDELSDFMVKREK